MNNNRHTLTAFDEDMDRIRGYISEMGSRADIALTNAMIALNTNDHDLATKTVKADKEIDVLEREVEALIVQTIAIRAPMADDLRELIAAMKMSGVIERIGDYAKNIAKRVKRMQARDFLEQDTQINRMATIAGEMVRTVMDAYARRDIDLARSVVDRDEEVDQLFKDLFVDLTAFIAKHPLLAEDIAHLLVICKNIERIGDHSETCAEMILFAETGEYFQD